MERVEFVKRSKNWTSRETPWVRLVSYWNSVHILARKHFTTISAHITKLHRSGHFPKVTRLVNHSTPVWLHTNYCFPLFELYTVKMAISVSICKGKHHTHCTDYWLSCAHCHFAPHFLPSIKLVTLPVLITGHTNFCCVAKRLLYLKRNVLPFISVSIPCIVNYNIPRPRSLFTKKRYHNKNTCSNTWHVLP